MGAAKGRGPDEVGEIIGSFRGHGVLLSFSDRQLGVAFGFRLPVPIECGVDGSGKRRRREVKCLGKARSVDHERFLELVEHLHHLAQVAVHE